MTSSGGQEVVFISTRSPWSNSSAAAGADLLMTTAVFEQPVRVVFAGDGVWQLLADQNGDQLRMKTLARIFPAFELYDIRHIFASESALHERGLSLPDLVSEVTAITDDEIRGLIANSKAVFVF